MVRFVAVLLAAIGTRGLWGAGTRPVPPGDLCGDCDGALARFTVNGTDLFLQQDPAALRRDLASGRLPHQAWSVLRVLELLDERGDVLLVPLAHQGV